MATPPPSTTFPPENTLPPTTSLAPVTTTLAPTLAPTTSTTSTPTIISAPDATFDTNADDPSVFVIPAAPDATFDTNADDPSVDITPAAGGLPSGASTTVTSPSPTVPPENTLSPTTSLDPNTRFVGSVTRADSVAVVRPRNQLVPDATFDTNGDDPPVVIVPEINPTSDTSATTLNPNTPFIGPVTRADSGSVAVVRPRDLFADPDATFDTNADDPPVVIVPDLIPVVAPSVGAPPEAPDNTTETSSDFIVSFLGRSLSVGNNIMYRGAVQGNDGKLYLVPYASNFVVATDFSSGAQPRYDITSFAREGSLAKFVGGAIAPSGKIYLGPQQASAPLIIDSNQTPPIFSQVAGGTQGVVTQARGPAYFNNRVYIPTYKNTNVGKWIVVNTDTDSLEPSITQPTHPVTDDIFITRVNYATENLGKALKHYTSLEGGVAGDNGKIYGMPYGASRINIVDTATQTSTWGADYIKGNAPIDNDLFSLRLPGMLQTKTYFNKYKYGALAGNGSIYAHGHRARSILKIDTSDDSATEIPYPQVIIDAMLNGGSADSADTAKAASFGSVLGGDGKVYSTPWNIPYLIWIDPKDDSIGYLDISDILDASGASNGWYTLATAVGNKLYFSPGISGKILVIQLPETKSADGATATFDTNADDPPVTIILDDGIVSDEPAVNPDSGPVNDANPGNPINTDGTDGGVVFDPEAGPSDIANPGIDIIVNPDGTIGLPGTPPTDPGTSPPAGTQPPTGTQPPAGTLPPPTGSTLPPPTGSTLPPPPPLNLVCYDDNSDSDSFDNVQDGANPYWLEAKVKAVGGKVSNYPASEPSAAFNLPVGADVKDLLELEVDPGNIISVDPAKVPDTVDKEVVYFVKIQIPERYDNSIQEYIVCKVTSYTSLSGKVLECYYDEKDGGVDENGNKIVGANPTWNNAAAALVGPNDISNFPAVIPSRIFNIPVGTIIWDPIAMASPLIDIEVGKLVGVDPLVVPNMAGPIRVDIEIEVPKNEGYNNISSIIECVMEMYPALSTTTPPPPPPPPPPGLPLDECLLECLTFTTPLPPPPGIQRGVPVRLTIPFERTTIPPSSALGGSEIIFPTTVEPSTFTTTFTTTTTTTKNPCPPECDIPSF